MTHLEKLEAVTKRLQAVQLKQAMKAPLSPTEENLIMDLERVLQMRPKEKVVFDDTQIHYLKSVEVDGIFEGVKEKMEREDASYVTSTNRGVAGAVYVGSIDELTAVNWAKECGAKMYSKAWMAHVKKKRESGDFAHFFPTRKVRSH